MFKITLACNGLPEAAATAAALDIESEFHEHRTWYTGVKCLWSDGRLLLIAESDVDEDGVALCDEFSDCIFAYVSDWEEFGIEIVDVAKIPSAA